ncbi:dTDP-4-dehydrorhamnose 3,5-epimerase [Deltaproteobacteria bacterium Smac51]|nr:dTDP-4-dehydrorhamnose 3,5-epimerase [Deltaproteobacteria bacterium Smac51]
MHMEAIRIGGLILLEYKTYGDDRGYFRETFRQDEINKIFGREIEFVQDNESLSKASVVRGLHFQRPPHAQAKLVKVSAGRIFDVAVDLRPGSNTYGRWDGYELSAENGKQLFIPEGFAHGFVALEDNTVVSYKVTDYYAPECDGGVLWDDPVIGIEWPLPGEPIVSGKDLNLPGLAELGNVF